ncbi:MAG: rhomboid family intramembrane serine protease [Bacteroidaceae bacterium]|nr:rhomboid family intramembrane serine protease [Bacteroidaceae bacterium]
MFQTPPITKNLIIINVLLFFAMIVGERWGLDLNAMLGLHFVKAPDFRLYQLLTYMFMHANTTHIFFNLFMFWMFGRTMETVWGPRKFLLFYLVCGIGAGLLQELVQLVQYHMEGLDQVSMIATDYGRMRTGDYLNLWTTVGASGAIYGILLGFGMTFPNERILLLIPPIPIKAKYMVIASAVIELLLGMNSQGDNVAHFAHLGGMLFGWLLIRHWNKQEQRTKSGFTTWKEYWPQQESLMQRIRKKVETFFGQKSEGKEGETFSDRNKDYDYNARQKAGQAEIDRILEKIKRSGYDSLTDEEKRKLFDASSKK